MNRVFIFTHMIKNGGTTFSYLLEHYFWAHRIHTPKDAQDYFKKPELKTALERWMVRTDDFMRDYHRRKNRIDLVRGHFRVGEAGKHLWGDDREIKFLTFLRDPVKRFISHANYEVDSLEMLEELAKHPEIDFNHQTSFLSGCKTAKAQPEDLEPAKKFLAQQDFIGLTEDMENSIETFCKTFGFPMLSAEGRSQNIGPSRPIPQEVKDRIRELCHLDVQLYEYGMKLYNERKEKYKDVPLTQPTLKDNITFAFRRLSRKITRARRYIGRGFVVARYEGPVVERLTS